MDIAAITHTIRTRLTPEVVDELRHSVDSKLDDLAAELTDLYQRKIPVYEHYDPEVIRGNTRMVLDMVVSQISDADQTLTVHTLADLARTLDSQGIPLEPVAHSIQLGARRIFGLIRNRAEELEVAPADLADIQDLAWEWATEGAAVIQQVQRDLAVAGAARRSDFARKLVAGDLPPTVLRQQTALYHLDTSTPYYIACLSLPDSGMLAEVVTALRLLGSTSNLQVFDAVVDGLVIALLPRHPGTVEHEVPIGLGPARGLDDASGSFAIARRALDIAQHHHVAKLVDLADLGPLTLVDAEPEAAAALTERHLAPLLELGPSGTEVIRTVTTYLERERRVDATAKALHLHRNTVHYRLRKFVEATNLDLDLTEDLVLAWWLLTRHSQGLSAAP